VLAGTERLDRELMIGQMQGKFQLEVISGVGHMLHEVRPFDLQIVGFGRNADSYEKLISG
jgi:hypothetical protein